MRILFIVFFALLFNSNIQAQDSVNSGQISFSAYLETFYCYDFGQPSNHERPPFFFSFNRHNEANLNLGFAKVNYTAKTIRCNFAAMVGTYAHYNLAAEPGLLKNVFEANAGIKIAKKHNIWIDAGIFPSHIGFESAIGKDCWNLTRSILADNSPYYEAGAKLSYVSKNDKFNFLFMYLNGWQRIQRIPGNQTPAFGTQMTYKPNIRTTLNWSTYIGNDQPDSLRKWRYFNNFYGQLNVAKKAGIIAGFDVGLQQQAKGSNAFDIWYSPILILRYIASEKIRIAGRAEYYNDSKGVIISKVSPNGFQTIGYSLNFDCLPAQNVMLRLEGRVLNSRDQIFILNNKPSRQNYFVTSSLAVSF